MFYSVETTNGESLPKLYNMHTDDSQNMPQMDAETPIPYEITKEILRSRLSNSISPLAIEIDCACIKAWIKNVAQERFRLNLLVKEIELWSQFLSVRPVNRFWLNRPLSLMDAPTLTELVYAINKYFTLSSGHHTEFAVTTADTCSRQDLALLRGLGCNHIQIAISPSANLEQINKKKESIEDLDFTFVSFSLSVNTDPNQDAMRIMECLSFLSPTSLRLEAEQLELSNIEQLTPMLMQFGYSFQYPNTVLKFRSPLHNPPTDVLRLGPGNISQLAGMKFVALKSPPLCHNFLQNDQIPIAKCY